MKLLTAALLCLPLVGWAQSPTIIDTSTGFFRIGYDNSDYSKPIQYMMLDRKSVRVPKCNNHKMDYDGKTLTCRPPAKPTGK